MFTGIIQHIGTVADMDTVRHRLEIQDSGVDRASRGDSISVNGVCLTLSSDVSSSATQPLSFRVLPETFRKSNLGLLSKGDRVNIETSLQAGHGIGGHFVTGHIDQTGEIIRIQKSAYEYLLWIRVSTELLPLIAPKGSIAVNGVSLTVLDTNNDSFSVYLVEETRNSTNLTAMKEGDRLNIEADIFSRYIYNILGPGMNKSLTMEQLNAFGY